MNPDLYACLPPDKKEEYKKLFPIPDFKPLYTQKLTIDSSGDSWVWPGVAKDDRLPPGIGVLGKIKFFPEGDPIIEGVILNFRESDNTSGYISSVEGEEFGAVCLIPPCGAPALPSLPCEYNSHRTYREIGLSPGEQRLIKKGVVDKNESP